MKQKLCSRNVYNFEVDIDGRVGSRFLRFTKFYSNITERNAYIIIVIDHNVLSA